MSVKLGEEWGGEAAMLAHFKALGTLRFCNIEE